MLTTLYHRARALAAHRATQMTRTIVRRVVATCAVILAVAFVTTITVDLGAWPWIKSKAEQQGTKYLKRSLHIGKLSFRLWTGRFLVDDLVIEGFTAEARPWLTAKHIEVTLAWSTLFHRQVVLDSIEMTDWQIYLEMLESGKHNLPKLTPEPSSDRKSAWTTTLRWVRAHRGAFTYEDHGTPWSIVTRDVDIVVAKPAGEYRGEARFSQGTIAIQDYVPFTAEVDSTFKIDGSRLLFDKIALASDGAKSMVTGDVNLKFFPEMMFRIESAMDFKRMRELFFAHESFRLAGTGRFEGYFHLFKERRPGGTSGTGRELFGTFSSNRAGVDVGTSGYRFDNLRGSVRWTARRLAVTDASADLYGGRARFGYEMSPLGVRGTRATARFTSTLTDLSLQRLFDFYEVEGMRLAGGLSGTLDLKWPLGQYSAGYLLTSALHIAPPPGTTLMATDLPVELIEQGRLPRGPAAPLAPLIPIPVGGDLAFQMGPGSLRLSPSFLATQRTFVRFEGDTTTSGVGSRIPFHVSSADWQESYRTFAAMLTALGSPTSTIEIGGYGKVDGLVLNDVRRPRIELASFSGERMRAWDVEWGSVRGHGVVENSYADLKDTVITKGASTITTDGRFSLGFPRKDGGEEINATVNLVNRPVIDLRHAFTFDRYPLDGLFSGQFHVFGNYRTPFGYGTMEIKDAVAYGEPLDSAKAVVARDGKGVRLTAVEMMKGDGRGSGAAYVDWDGAYSFDFASTVPIPVEAVKLVHDNAPEGLPLSGLIDFHAIGNGNFDSPRYTVTGTIRDLFVADEGIGQVNVKSLAITGDTMMLDAEVASPRLDVDILGTMDLTDDKAVDVRFNVNKTSLDPYVRAFEPRLSPFTTAIVSGVVNVKGPLARPETLAVTAHVTELDMRLFDYQLTSAGPFDIEFDRNTVRVAKPAGLFGNDTRLQISGEVGVEDETVAMSVSGLASLALLQAFDPRISSRGNAMLSATVSGALRNPVVRGTLQIENGRIRHFGAPLALEQIAGPITFTETGVSVDGLTAELGRGGRVQFEGTIEKQGYLPGQMNITMSSVGGQGVRVNYPEGMRSTVDIERLTLRGTVADMHLDGEIRVIDALYQQPFPSPNVLLSLLAGNPAQPVAEEEALSLPLT